MLETPLAKLTKATTMLAEVRTAGEAKKLMDVAAAAEHYAKKAQLGQDAIDHAHVIKIDAQRMLGEFLKQTPKANGGEYGGKSRLDGSRREPSNQTPTLSDTGLTKRLSSDSQMLATIAESKPQVFEQVRIGKLTPRQAIRSVINEKKTNALKAKAAAVTAGPELPYQVICGDCIEELAKLDAASVRLIFADPPYNIGRDYHGQGPKADSHPDHQYLAWCEHWMSECVRVLTDDGSLWVMISDDYADDFGVILRRTLGLNRRAWIKWYETFGVNRPNNFNRTSRHIFYMTKDASRFVFHESEVNRPSDRQLKYGDKRADTAGKTLDDVWGIDSDPLSRLCGTADEKIPGYDNQLPVALVSRIIRCASDPGDTVADPFNGTGTTGVAALRCGRAYIGIEKNAKAVEVSGDRIKVETSLRRAS